MKPIFLEFSLLLFLALCVTPVANAADHALELKPLPDSAWGEDWAGGCWFHKESDSKGGGGQLMFLIRGEGGR